MVSIEEKLSQLTEFETPRLLLRPVTLDDSKEMFDYASDEENVRFAFKRNETIEETRTIIAKRYLAKPLGLYGIVEKKSNTFIGTLDLQNMNNDLGRAEIGYCLNKHFWNQGYATEALKAFIKLYFEVLKMNLLIAQHDTANPASGRVMEKAGMLFSHNMPYDKIDDKDPSRLITSATYLLTKEDYFNAVESY